MSLTDDSARCGGCGWRYYPLNANDHGVCGTCARERGLAPRTAETDELDRRIREQQHAQLTRLARDLDREGGTPA